jgi:hypothetical protein
MPHRLILSSESVSEKRPFEVRSLARKRLYLAVLIVLRSPAAPALVYRLRLVSRSASQSIRKWLDRDLRIVGLHEFIRPFILRCGTRDQ